MEELWVEVYRVLTVRKDWMTREEIEQAILPLTAKRLQLYTVLNGLIEAKRVERYRKFGCTTRYRVLQTGSVRATRSNADWRSRFMIPQPGPA